MKTLTSTLGRRLHGYGVSILVLAAGIIYAIAFGIGGDWADGGAGFAIMAGFAVILAAGNRYGGLRRLRGVKDEREQWLDAQAVHFSYVVAVVVFTSLWLVNIVQGHTNTQWGLVDAVLGGSYLLAVAYQAVRDR